MDIPLNSIMGSPIRIPNGVGGYFMSTLHVKIDDIDYDLHWLHGPEHRFPHSHRRSFVSEILEGSLTEERFWIEDGHVRSKIVTHTVGETYTMPINLYDKIISVEEDTRTIIRIPPNEKEGKTDFLNPGTGLVCQKTYDKFLVDHRALNPHIKFDS